jgi:DNA polymerase-3 subunit delta
VSERAVALAETFSRHKKGDAEIIRLDDRDFADDPARLEVELRTRPMFAASKVVRVSAGARLDVTSLKETLAAPFDHALIVEAGNLRPDSGLRKLFESNPKAAALPCYGGDDDLADLVDAELAAAGLKIDGDTKTYLMSRLGADQALSRSEVMKLAVYARGGDRVSTEDIDAVVGDAAEVALENFVYAASGGDPRRSLRELQRLAAAGTGPAAALAALARHFGQLHKIAATLASGGTFQDAMKSYWPRPNRTQQDMLLAHCKRWGATRLAHTLPLIQEAISRTRLSAELETAFAERLLLKLTAKV